MSNNRLLWGIIAVLLITNVATLIYLSVNDGGNLGKGEDTSFASGDTVATIAGEDITYGEWMTALREDYGRKTLQSLIDRHIVAKMAEEQNIVIGEKVIERDLAYLTSMQGPLMAKELEKEEAKWREELIYRYQLEFLLTEGYTIPDSELEAYYEEYKNQYDFSPAMQLSHILVPDMETANKVYEEIEQGANFSLLAREYSVDDESRNNGGYLGFITTNSQFFPNGYEEVANGMEEHSYSEPFAADNGIAIIYLHQALPGITFSYDEIKPYMENEMVLHQENIPLQAAPLWEVVDVDWIFAQ